MKDTGIDRHVPSGWGDEMTPFSSLSADTCCLLHKENTAETLSGVSLAFHLLPTYKLPTSPDLLASTLAVTGSPDPTAPALESLRPQSWFSNCHSVQNATSSGSVSPPSPPVPAFSILDPIPTPDPWHHLQLALLSTEICILPRCSLWVTAADSCPHHLIPQ